MGDVTVTSLASNGTGTLCSHLRELRGAATLAEAAARAGMRPDELSRIERGRTKQIRFDTVLRLATAYRCDVGDLFEVRPAAARGEEPYAPVLAALRRGALTAGAPGRRPPVEEPADERLDFVPSAVRSEVFVEPGDSRVRRGAFRPER